MARESEHPRRGGRIVTTELFEVVTPATALERLLAHLRPIEQRELVAGPEAVGRVLAADVRAPEASPAFRRSVMDGYAVRASDTFGATEGLPAFLPISGEVPMGAQAGDDLAPGDATLIHTGGMLPPGADAVVMVEFTQEVGDATIEVMRPVAPGENMVEAGEDVRQGDTVLSAGHRLRAHDVGALAALGVTHVEVTRRPRIGILSTGDEVIPADSTPDPGQVRDVNSTALAARARQTGAEPRVYGIAPDNRDALGALSRRAFEECDLTAISAGSSVSTRDLTAEAISALGKPGVLAHGVSVKPGKPTIVAVAEGKPIFGLPGNPVSALVIFEVLVAPTIQHLLGATTAPPVAHARARLARNIASAAGRVDFVQARLVEREGELWAEPEFGKSNLIFTMVRATGVIEVPLDLAGLREGAWVDVRLH